MSSVLANLGLGFSMSHLTRHYDEKEKDEDNDYGEEEEDKDDDYVV